MEQKNYKQTKQKVCNRLFLFIYFFSKLRAETMKWIRMIMRCKNDELQGIGDRQIQTPTMITALRKTY